MLDHPEGATMCRTRLVVVGLVVALLAAACGSGEDSDPADRENETYSGASVTSEDEPAQNGHARASAAPAEESQQAPAPAVAAPVQLGERFSWCANVQALWDAQDRARAETETAAAAHEAAVGVFEAATDDLDRAEAGEAVDDAYASYVFSTRDYGRVRWHAAALIFSDEPNLLGRAREDSTLQVAIERARDAYRANAAAHTLAALDFAHEATEGRGTLQHRHERSDIEQSGPAVDVSRTRSGVHWMPLRPGSAPPKPSKTPSTASRTPKPQGTTPPEQPPSRKLPRTKLKTPLGPSTAPPSSTANGRR